MNKKVLIFIWCAVLFFVTVLAAADTVLSETQETTGLPSDLLPLAASSEIDENQKLPPEAWVLQPLTGLGTGLTINTATMAVADMLSILLIQWLIYTPADISIEEGLNLTSHYSLLGSSALLYPLLANLGVRAYGEALGFNSSGIGLLLSYAGSAAGTTLYFLGYREAGVYTLLTAPIVGAMTGFLLTRKPLENAVAVKEPSQFPHYDRAIQLLHDFLGAAAGDLLFLSGKLQIPLMTNNPSDQLVDPSYLFQAKPIDMLLFLPVSTAGGITVIEHINRRRGAPLFTVCATLAGSTVGWGVSKLLGSDSSVPAHILAIASGALTTFFLSRPED